MPENLSDTGWVTLQVAVPPELVAIGVAPDLQRFFDAMIYKLRRNSHKGRWDTLPISKAVTDLGDEVEELIFATANGSTSEILMEAADVANEALIVAAIALEAKDATLTPRHAGRDDRHEGDESQRGKGDALARRIATQLEIASKGPGGF